MRKHFDLMQEHDDLLQEIKNEKGFRSKNLALQFVMSEYIRMRNQEKNNDLLVDNMISKFMEQNKSYIERLRWATRTAEQNSIYILDAINTILFKYNITDCSPVEVIESPVISTSKMILKGKLEHFKQAKEDRKKRSNKFS